MRPLLLAALLLPAPALAERLAATADCAERGALTYHCTLTLTRGDAPVEGAAFTVRPEMPSMPMAHNIEPVAAEPGEMPGAYEVTLTLDMHGRWLLSLDLTEPARDKVVVDHEFTPGDGMEGHGGHGS